MLRYHLLLMLLAPSLGFAQGELALHSALRQALASSPVVHSTKAAAEASRARSTQARAGRLPSVDLVESFSRTDNPAEVFALLLNQERFDMNAFFQGDPNRPDSLSTWMTRLQVTQPVYTGGKLATRIDQADLAAEAGAASARHARQSVAHDTVTSYAALAKAREYLELLRTARATTERHVELAESYAGQGLIVEAELLKARVYLAEMDELLARADNGARLAESSLNFHMGLTQSSHHILKPLPPPPAVTGTLETWTSAALGRRDDLAAARLRLEAGRLEERAARSGFLPEVALIGRYDLYDDSFAGSNGDSASVMAMASINLFSGGGDRAAVTAARHTTVAGEQQLRRFSEGVTLEVQQAWQDLETARLRHTSARASLESAREALRVREHRFSQGLDRMIDLLDAETGLREADVREMVARYDFFLAAFRLHFASGANLTELVNPVEDDS